MAATLTRVDLARAAAAGRHYYSQRFPHETAEYVAPCYSADPDERRAFCDAWNAAAAMEATTRELGGGDLAVRLNLERMADGA